MKKSILTVGRFIFDLITFITFLCMVPIATISGVALYEGFQNGFGAFCGGIAVLIILFILLCSAYYFIYLIFDINDNLKEISQKLSSLQKTNNDKAQVCEDKPAVCEPICENKCPKCGVVHSKDDKFCENCGEKLDK